MIFHSFSRGSRHSAFRPFLLATILTLGFQVSLQANLIPDSGFEAVEENWGGPFVPEKYKDAGAEGFIVRAGAKNGNACLQMSSQEDARYSMYPSGKPMAVEPGEHLRIKAWIKAGDDFEAVAGTPGALIRIPFRFEDRADGGVENQYLIDWKGNVVTGDHLKRLELEEAVPTTWTQIEAVVVVPDDMYEASLNLFVWSGAGTIFWDDVEVETVDSDVKATPLAQLKKK